MNPPKLQTFISTPCIQKQSTFGAVGADDKIVLSENDGSRRSIGVYSAYMGDSEIVEVTTGSVRSRKKGLEAARRDEKRQRRRIEENIFGTLLVFPLIYFLLAHS